MSEQVLEELARTALLEVTPESTVGPRTAIEPRPSDSDGAELVDVVYASTQAGYTGWSWVVTLATVEGGEPTVLELGLLPGEGALLSPEWVPWSVRLAEWQAQQAELAEDDDDDAESDDDDEVDDGDDESDDDDDESDDEDESDDDDDDDESDDDEDDDTDSDDDDDDTDSDDDDEDSDDDDDTYGDDDDDDTYEDDDLIDPDDEPVGSMREGDIDGVDIDSLDETAD